MLNSNKIISKNMKCSIMKTFPLLVIIFIGFLLRLYFSRILAIRGDETGFLYDSYLITQGEIPFKDFHKKNCMAL